MPVKQSGKIPIELNIDMNNKFDAVSIEQDTTLLFQLNATLGDYDVSISVEKYPPNSVE